MKNNLLSFFLLIQISLNAQINGRLNVPFTSSNGDLYPNALTGGFEAPQFHEIDLNLDGIKDLLVFDRKGSVMRTFLYDESKTFPYVYAPEFEAIFPNIQCWLNVQDFNKDGIDDLFTCGVTDPVTGIEVWTGHIIDGKLGFSAFHHTNSPYNIIYYEDGSKFKQLYVGNNGIPAFSDLDQDGDIDILAFQPSGGYLYHFKNMSVERGFNSDSLLYIQSDFCWGKFYEGGLIPDIILSPDETNCALPSEIMNSSTRHEGITITAFDKNGDGLQDLLLGEVTSKNLIYIENGGTIDNAFATYKEKDFPADDVPVEMAIFLASFIIDVDRDGRKDIIVSPNSSFATNTENAWYYKNVDQNGSSVYELIQEDWLVGTSLDFGTDSYPSFVDYNADGLVDIVIGSYALIGKPEGVITKLVLFENIGDENNPKYTLKDDDYLGFSAYSSFDKSYTPAFGDLDGDKDLDILMGSLAGDLIYMENIAGEGNPLSFNTPIFDFFELNTENNSVRTTIVDINEDGLGDIVVGGRNSYSVSDGIVSLKYFLNTGTISNPKFSNELSVLGYGDVNVKDAGDSKVSAAPKYYKAGSTDYLFVGNEVGRIAVYEKNESENDFELYTDNLFQQYFGRRITVDISDIDNDGFLELIAGNERGGINIFDTVIQSNGEISSVFNPANSGNSITVFPNPANATLTFDGLGKRAHKVLIYDNLGRLIGSEIINDNILDIEYLSPGIYFFKLSDHTVIHSGKFIKL